VPLKVVVSAMRVSSAVSWPISVWMAAVASRLSAPALAAWTARLRIRWRMAVVVPSAPSAVCTTLTASWVLRTAWVMPPICERRPSEIASPAASSAARLIREPEESRSSEVVRASLVVARLRWAFIATVLVVTLKPTVAPPSRVARRGDHRGYQGQRRGTGGVDPNGETRCAGQRSPRRQALVRTTSCCVARVIAT
jgi:hypothetical protein